MKAVIITLAAVLCACLAIVWIIPLSWTVIDETSLESAYTETYGWGEYSEKSAVSETMMLELAEIINGYGKTRYVTGDDEAKTGDSFVTLNCTDGSYYILHYWYANSFSFNPAHPGEDDYYSIITYYGADGKAKRTWKMEYDFDSSYYEWVCAA